MSTADQIRRRRIVIPIPPDCTVEVRRPDLLSQAVHDLLPLPLYGDVIDALGLAITGGAATDAGASPSAERFDEFLDRWTCLAAVVPRVVMSADEADRDPTCLHITEVPAEIKLAVFAATRQELVSKGARDAVATFRQSASVGAVAG